MKNRRLLVAGLLILAGAMHGRGLSARLRADDQQNGAEKNDVAAAELDPDLVEMAKAAEQTYEAFQSAYQAGTATSTDVYIWSRRWLDSQRALAKNHAEQMTALRQHRRRMMKMFLQINALYIEGVKGGEAERFHAAQYYLAEANALLGQAATPDEKGPAKAKVAFSGPEGMIVQWDEKGDGRKPDSEPLVCPATHEYRRGRIYRMRLANLPGFKGLKANATLELVAPFSEPVPIGLSTSDAEMLLKDGSTSRVIYATGQSEIHSIRGNSVTPTDDIIDQAESKGTVLAIFCIWRAR